MLKEKKRVGGHLSSKVFCAGRVSCEFDGNYFKDVHLAQ